MRFAIILFLVASTSGCSTIDCGPKTIERNGACEPANETIDTAQCGSGTVLLGEQCVPTVACDPATTISMPDPNDPNKTICVGTGGAKIPCDQELTCPPAATGKQTICGQLYDIEDNTKFAAPGADGTKCDGTATSGPCALAVTPVDAFAFASSSDPSSTPPLPNGGTYIDNCGRYQVKDIDQPTSPFIGLGFDDANPSNIHEAGVTNTTGVATAAIPGDSTTGLEAWIAKKSTTDMWTATGGPPVSGGIYVGIFRAHRCDASKVCSDTDLPANQSGVTMTLMGSQLPANDYYFTPAETGRTTVVASATATGANGTGLLTGASITNSINYSGTGGINDTTNCKWEQKAAASLANIVFFQVYRPTNIPGHTCNQ